LHLLAAVKRAAAEDSGNVLYELLGGPLAIVSTVCGQTQKHEFFLVPLSHVTPLDTASMGAAREWCNKLKTSHEFAFNEMYGSVQYGLFKVLCHLKILAFEELSTGVLNWCLSEKWTCRLRREVDLFPTHENSSARSLDSSLEGAAAGAADNNISFTELATFLGLPSLEVANINVVVQKAEAAAAT